MAFILIGIYVIVSIFGENEIYGEDYIIRIFIQRPTNNLIKRFSNFLCALYPTVQGTEFLTCECETIYKYLCYGRNDTCIQFIAWITVITEY